MDIRKWAYCRTFTILPEYLKSFCEDDVFGADQTSRWHLSRGYPKRLLRTDPRWRWINTYETVVGFVTDDRDIIARFDRLARFVMDSKQRGT